MADLTTRTAGCTAPGSLASCAGIPTFQVDRTNLARILRHLETFDIVKETITEFVNAGFIGALPQRNQRLNDRRAWLVDDPRTGPADFFVAGFLAETQG